MLFLLLLVAMPSAYAQERDTHKEVYVGLRRDDCFRCKPIIRMTLHQLAQQDAMDLTLVVYRMRPVEMRDFMKKMGFDPDHLQVDVIYRPADIQALPFEIESMEVVWVKEGGHQRAAMGRYDNSAVMEMLGLP